MSKKTIFMILASTIVALGASLGHADRKPRGPVRDGREYGSADGYDYGAPGPAPGPAGAYGAPAAQGLPYRALAPAGYPVARSGYGVQNQGPIVNGTWLRPDGSPILRGPKQPVFGECTPLPDGIYVDSAVIGGYPVRKYSSLREAQLFETRDLETLIAAGVCKF